MKARLGDGRKWEGAEAPNTPLTEPRVAAAATAKGEEKKLNCMMAQLHGRPRGEASLRPSLNVLPAARLILPNAALRLSIPLRHCAQPVLSVSRPWQTDRRPPWGPGGLVSCSPPLPPS